jgi:hypothetical protein
LALSLAALIFAAFANEFNIDAVLKINIRNIAVYSVLENKI